MTAKDMLCVQTCIDNIILYYIPVVYSIYGVKDGENFGHIYHALNVLFSTEAIFSCLHCVFALGAVIAAPLTIMNVIT